MADEPVVVTGAGTGIGRAVAARLVGDGYRVVGVGRRRDPLDDTLRAVARGPGRFEPHAADVRDGATLIELFRSFGPLRGIVANAGVVRQSRLRDAGAADTWRSVLATNLDGAFHTLHAAEPLLVDSGRVVFVSSGLGKLGRAGFAAYSASKHGVLGLMRSAALELAPRKITVNAVCPGWVDTDMARSDLARFARDRGLEPGAVAAEVLERIPLGRFVRADEVASLVCWLIGSESSAITGEAFDVSAGEFMT